ncbi:MAG: FAD-binding oxidoreductase [Chloroflexi bacterium]|nr:FAD-binding oxidoreductase [Chloroflexota bacterium]
MKRWNGWGDVHIHYPLPDVGIDYLRAQLGPLEARADVSMDAILATMPDSRLPDHPLIDIAPETRLRHARGQSLPDWVALNYGRIEAFPDGVAFPNGADDVRELLGLARTRGIRVIPYGGGTSVVGHINPLPGARPTLTLSMEKLNRLLELDEVSRLATFEAGVTGPSLEAQLKAHGYTLGHFPQSFEYSTLGGWIATRSSGQQSYYYGRIEQLFAGGRVETPRGPLELPPFPASATGPDVREMILGSEGRMGLITRAQVRVRPIPKAEGFYGIFFPTWEQGVAAVRGIAQNGIPVSMLRLSNPQETETSLLISGKSWLKLADRGLRLMGQGDQRCLLIFGVTGSAAHVRRTRGAVKSFCRSFRGFYVGAMVGRTWEKNRFRSAYLRNTLWRHGVAVDTLETALPWSQVEAAAQAIPRSIVDAAAAFGERVLVMTHLSHIYRDGASIYVTYLFRRCADPDELLARWRAMKGAASHAIQAHGGAISHQHGVGTDHAAYLLAEKGELGMAAIRSLCQTFDPDGIMNPGKLIL